MWRTVKLWIVMQDFTTASSQRHCGNLTVRLPQVNQVHQLRATMVKGYIVVANMVMAVYVLCCIYVSYKKCKYELQPKYTKEGGCC